MAATRLSRVSVVPCGLVKPRTSASWRRKTALAVGSTLLTLAFAEGALRLSGAEVYPVPLYPGDVAVVRDRTWDPAIGWKLPPGRDNSRSDR